ncbi:type IV secretion system DNA-binding domain-containing protein [Sulfurospirillum oryzae]|uniref:type IV secretion system DNA-binding domain-containing protein n=1 Tax=Sulfurospirillum oryzae TaxID=2976535 RepID=UPI0021E817FF|nr:type IV secretion system DNA-binding domain-containing protein [Sulfurospirillum oryzae]
MRIETATFLILIAANTIISYQVQKELGIHKALIFTILSFFEYIIWHMFIREYSKINDRLFDVKSWLMGSYANFYGQSEGNRWTPSWLVKQKMKNGDLFIDKFRFDGSVLRNFKFFSFKKWFNNFDCYMIPSDLKKGGIVFGSMGAGKTELFHSILSQPEFDRKFIYDSKGDFTQKHYRSNRDIILNPYDARGHVWNPFEEANTSPFVVGIFMTNLFNAIAGDKKDFFSAGSQDRYMELFNSIQYMDSKLTAKQKFDLFIKLLKEYFEAPQTQSRTSEADIASTMKLSFEFFDYMNFCIQNGSPTFTIHNYLSQKNCDLFLLSRDDQKSKLTAFFTGFLAAFVAVMLSQEDRDSLTLLALDEYLSFVRNMDSETIESLHVRIRSKGGCLLPGVQFFPDDHLSDGLTQKILNSTTYWFLFQGIDEYTLNKIGSTVGKVRYKKEQAKDIRAERFANKDYSIEESDLLNISIFHSLGEKYEHITFIPSRKILYKGYTPQVKLKNRNESFIQSENIAKFYQQKSRA